MKVIATLGTGHTIHLANNYWGTTSVEEITASIQDHGDDPRITGTVLFAPFLDGPVATDGLSFGELKARYGSQ